MKSLSDYKKVILIVESVKKSHTIKSMFPSIEVLSCRGHVEDVIKYDENFNIEFQYNKNGEDIKKILKLNNNSENLCLIGVDPDREGEQIANSLYKLIKQFADKIQTQRIIFNKITKSDIEFAINNPVELNYNMVLAQNARVIIDRMIGFNISRVIQYYLGRTNGCGRIQSLVILFMYQKFNAIKNFVPSTYYDLIANFKNISLQHNATKKIDNIEDLEKIKNKIKENKLYFVNCKISNICSKPKHLLNTVDIYKEAFKLLGYSSKKTSQLMQNLFEGVMINNITKGLISYPRSDSRRINKEYEDQVKEFFTSNNMENLFCNKHINIQKKLYIQDAHECVHPIDVNLTPELIKDQVTNELYRLYNMIYNLTMAAFCVGYEYTKYTQYFTDYNKEQKFINTYLELKQQGVLKFLPYLAKTTLNNKIEDEIIEVQFNIKSYKTTPPAAYKEYQIIDLLSKNNIGRPSSYSSIIPKLLEKNQISDNNNELYITKMGIVINRHLQLFFNFLFNIEFTSKLEQQFNEIVLDKSCYYDVINNCKKQIDDKLKDYEEFVRTKIKAVDINCCYCNKSTKLLTGKFGSYIACERGHKVSVIFDGKELFINRNFYLKNSLNHCNVCNELLCIKNRKLFCIKKCTISNKYTSINIKSNSHNNKVFDILKQNYLTPLFDIECAEYEHK